jgi:hypothetical protein
LSLSTLQRCVWCDCLSKGVWQSGRSLQPPAL